MGRIGFKSYDEEASKKEASPKDKQNKAQKGLAKSVMDANRKVFADLLLQKYTTEGDTAHAEYLTSRQLMYDFRDMCTVSLPDVAAVMNELEFHTASIGDEFAWLLYTKVKD